jgi:hypothetical protein
MRQSRRAVALIVVTLLICPSAAESGTGYDYTFTWRQRPDEVKLKACIADMRRVIAATDSLLAGPDGTGKPLVNEGQIQFNGRGDDAATPFIFPGYARSNGCAPFWNYYGGVVAACLLVAQEHFPDILVIDGHGDWGTGRDLYRRVFGKPPHSSLGRSAGEEPWEGPSDSDWLLRLLIVAAMALLLWWGLRPRYAFVIRVRNGRTRLSRGKATQRFMEEVGEICQQHDVTRGTIRGFLVRRRLLLAFSWNIPRPCRQRIRNIWLLHK